MKYITIVDDARDLGRVLQTLMLTITKDLAISVVPSAEEALLYSGQHPIDLLVTDIRLPGISGLDLSLIHMPCSRPHRTRMGIMPRR